MALDISKWTELVEQGVRYKENFGNSKRWSVYRDYGRGKFPGYVSSTQGILPYNITHSMKRGMVPNVYFRNPHITVTARGKPGMEIQAKIIEATDNWLIQEMGVKEMFKTMIMDCYYTNRGIAKLGYDGPSTVSKKPWWKLSDTQEAEAKGIPATSWGKKGKERVDYDVNIRPGMPWTQRIIPDTFIVPFGVRTLDDCPWVDHVVIKALEDVKNSRIYTNTDGLDGTHMETVLKDVNKADFYKELSAQVDLVEIHEIRDFKRREICAFVPGYEKWIRPPSEDILQVDGLPFVDFTFNEDCEYYWGPSDVQIMEPQQLEINETRTQAMLHRRIALVKFIVEEQGIDDIEIGKMISEEVGPVVKVKGNPKDIISLLQPHMPPELLQWTEAILSDVRGLLGQSKQSQGEAPPGRRTKFEMEVVTSGTDLRMDERRDIVATALVKLMRKTNQIIFKKWDMDKVVQVVGYDGAKYWVSYKGTENRAEYDYRVDVESMTPKTKAVKKREIVELIQALGKNPRANIDYLMKILLREYEWVDAMKVFPEAQETMQNPMEQKQFQQQQNALLGDRKQLGERASANAEQIGRLL